MVGDLKEIYHLFNPNKALQNDDLENYYVEIDQNETNIEELKIRLELSLETYEPIKLLFTGHRGSGKTTALNRLVSYLNREMGDKFFIVHFSVLDLLDNNDINYTDVLFSILTKIMEKCQEECDISSSLVERTKKWGKAITKTEICEDKLEGGAGFSLPFYFVELLARMKSETTTRQEIREEIQPRVSELINLINDIIAEIEISGRQVLVIIDNLEKCDYEKALNLFYCHSTQLTQPMCKIIYTFPISLRSSNKFTQIKMNFSENIIYPNIKVREKDENITETAGRAFMKQIVVKRVSLELFTPEALEYIIDMSGGVIREFIRIIRDSAVRAISRRKTLIDKDIAVEVINGLKNSYQAQLSDEDYEVLLGIYETKDIKRDERLVGLLHNLSVLEYKNGRSWCDINPIVRSILEEKNLLPKK
ncbi:P-loop NTPase fold protein [Methanosarcina sp. Z-7115]|uniref:P-loop NTPase fold protein n=1 Tax=Methanosarcina baikalica TaxID=3073890 RepID=A0ABU2CZ48_9EURY|nr:P-loop NTPase fold protein [Methanosarcina sp. Z-7115]MDR7664857.1 P-loop NTPase fold protein [Methanosarcina sp. Z-7115]